MTSSMWTCAAHNVTTAGDCYRCDAELVALITEAPPSCGNCQRGSCSSCTGDSCPCCDVDICPCNLGKETR